MTSIVILGSGFGGVHAYRRLFELFKDDVSISVTLISRNDYFWFTPMAHEVATGSLSLGSITYSLRSLPYSDRFHILQGNVQGVDFDKQHVRYTLGDNHTEQEIHYDYLISALGARTDFLGVPGAKEYSLPLKTRDDVVRIKKQILTHFEDAKTCTEEEQKRKLSFVVVGGGATGVELTSELHDLIYREFAKVFPKTVKNASIHIFHSRSRLLHEEDEWISSRALKVLQKKGVYVHLSTRVTHVDSQRISWNGGSVDAGCVFWTSGVRAVDVPLHHSREVMIHPKNNRIHVTSMLSLASYPHVFVVGDQAWCEEKESGQPYPMRAQFAVRQGVLAAQNIESLIEHKPLKEFAWKDKGFLVSLGKGDALARIFSFRFGGVVAWWLYRTIYIPQIIGLRNKLRVLFEWTLNLFLSRDLSDL